jgi:hypothetical protein
MITDLHRLLATASVAPVLFAGLEGAVRAWRGTPPGVLASRLAALVLVSLGMTSAGGLGLLLSGARPTELLHLVYAVLAFGAVPVAASLSGQMEPRRRGAVTFLGALVALAVIARLFATG